jgi:hypothetical protein
MKRKHEKRVIEKLKGRKHPFQKDVGSLFSLVTEGVASRARAREATPSVTSAREATNKIFNIIFWRKINMVFFILALVQAIELSPDFVNGLVEAQGCFNVKIKAISKKNNITEIEIVPSFFILQGNIARKLILALPGFFNQEINRVRKESKANTLLRYETKNVDDLLTNICPHFDKFPLLSEKSQDYCLFKEVLEILQKERKLSKESLLLIINNVYKMNLSSLNDKSSKKEAMEHWLKVIVKNY